MSENPGSLHPDPLQLVPPGEPTSQFPFHSHPSPLLIEPLNSNNPRYPHDLSFVAKLRLLTQRQSQDNLSINKIRINVRDNFSLKGSEFSIYLRYQDCTSYQTQCILMSLWNIWCLSFVGYQIVCRWFVTHRVIKESTEIPGLNQSL